MTREFSCFKRNKHQTNGPLLPFRLSESNSEEVSAETGALKKLPVHQQKLKKGQVNDFFRQLLFSQTLSSSFLFLFFNSLGDFSAFDEG